MNAFPGLSPGIVARRGVDLVIREVTELLLLVVIVSLIIVLVAMIHPVVHDV